MKTVNEKLKAIIVDESIYEWEDGMKYTMAVIFRCLLIEKMKFMRKTQRLSSNGYDGLSTTKKEKFEKIIESHNWQAKFDEFLKLWSDAIDEKQK